MKRVKLTKSLVSGKAPKRKRGRHTYTLAKSTIETMDKLMESEEIKSHSRVIDMAIEFFALHAKDIHLKVSPSVRKKLTAHFLNHQRVMPAVGLAHYAESLVKD